MSSLPNFSYYLFQKFQFDELTFLYRGAFHESITDKVLDLSHHSSASNTRLQKKLGAVMIECFQNIIKHAESPDILNHTNAKPSMFFIRNVFDQYYISSVNLVDRDGADGLASKLNHLKTLSTQELDKFYKSVLASEYPDQGRGGLGLLDMARRSRKPIQYSFDFVNYFYSLFFLQIQFDNIEKPQLDFSENHISLDDTKEIYDLMQDNNVLLVHKGNYSQRVILSLIQMVESHLKLNNEQLGKIKRIFFILTELLQNIIKHSSKTRDLPQGIITISKRLGTFVINTGNVIENTIVDELEKYLEQLNNLDEFELGHLYRNQILNALSSKGNDSGLGLIDIAKEKSNTFIYSVEPIDEHLSFYSISVMI